MFPWRDTCVPNVGKSCFNAQISLCPGVCAGGVSSEDYTTHIKNLSLFFAGKKKELIKKLTKDMKVFAQEKRFEEALRIKKTLFTLAHIHDIALVKEDYTNFVRSETRIEAYDIAHLAGRSPVGVMVVLTNGIPDKAEYRTFIIKTAQGGDDLKSLEEVIKRRLAHREWAYPGLMVIDGGKTHRDMAARVLREMAVNVPVVSVVKDDRHKARAIIGSKKEIREREKIILLANAESHRFALKTHVRARRKQFLRNS